MAAFIGPFPAPADMPGSELARLGAQLGANISSGNHIMTPWERDCLRARKSTCCLNPHVLAKTNLAPLIPSLSLLAPTGEVGSGRKYHLLEDFLQLCLQDDHALPIGRVPHVGQVVDALAPPAPCPSQARYLSIFMQHLFCYIVQLQSVCRYGSIPTSHIKDDFISFP